MDCCSNGNIEIAYWIYTKIANENINIHDDNYKAFINNSKNDYFEITL